MDAINYRFRSRGVCLFATLLMLGLAPARASADVCLTIDEARDLFTPPERSAALLLLARQFELAGEHVVPAGCETLYRVSHVQLGKMISITLSGPNGQRDALAVGLEDIPAVYSQMVRSLLGNQPMEARGVVDRTNVSTAQSASRHRVYSDSVVYSRLGFGTSFGDRNYSGPSVGVFGYRKELDAFAIDVSFLNFLFKSSDRGYSYLPTGSEGRTGEFIKLEALHFLSPLSGRSAYLGGGMSFTNTDLTNGSTSLSGTGLQGIVTAGYEVGRASTIRMFIQVDGGLPFYKLRTETFSYSYTPVFGAPYGPPSTTTGHRYVPSLSLSIGFGWQRGGGE